MSLEEAIKENTQAINTLIKMWQMHEIKTNEEKEEKEEALKHVESSTVIEEQVEEIEANEVDDVAVTWDEIREALTKHVQVKGRQSAINIMTAHGIQGKLTQDQLKEEDYGKFYAALTA